VCLAVVVPRLPASTKMGLNMSDVLACGSHVSDAARGIYNGSRSCQALPSRISCTAISRLRPLLTLRTRLRVLKRHRGGEQKAGSIADFTSSLPPSLSANPLYSLRLTSIEARCCMEEPLARTRGIP
jgi:hypothetical protein